MAEVAPAAAADGAAPAKALKQKIARRRKRAGPSLGEMIVKAVSAYDERSGLFLPALKKALAASFYDVEKNNTRVKMVINGLVTKGTLVQTKGFGANGSFRINKKLAVAAKKKSAK